VSGEALAPLLKRAPGVRLVVLNLCWGGKLVDRHPFAGLAHAIVGAGIPSVVAMRTEISDAAAGRATPALFRALAANATIDEAVTRARVAMQATHQQSVCEWSVPTLFLHERCRQGWLFKVSVVADGGPPEDPLSKGEDSLRRVLQHEVGHFQIERIIMAARHARMRGRWGTVSELAEFVPGNDVARRLQEEAHANLHADELGEACEILAEEDDERLARAQAIAASLQGQLADDLLQPLVAEIELASRLSSLWHDANGALTEGRWEDAVSVCDEILGQRPAGFRDIVGIRRRARLRLDAARAMIAELWQEAATIWSELDACDPDPDIARNSAYCEGRHAQEDERWEVAMQAFAAAGSLFDAPSRCTYAEGRAAERDPLWHSAVAAFERLPEPVGLDAQLPDRMRYARGRDAELRGDWPDAAACYENLDFGDAGERHRFARGQAAQQAGDWAAVICGLDDLSDGDREGQVGIVRGYARARLATRRGNDWATVQSELRDKPADHAGGDLGRLRSYATGRLAEQDDDWPAAVAAYAELAEGYEDAPARRAYAAGRNADYRGDLDAAITAYGEAGEHADASLRATYLRARLAEANGRWEQAAAGYGELPDGFADGAVRLAHARARRAAQDERWEAALQALAPDGDAHPDAAAMRPYWSGRAAERGSRWATAARAFTACALLADAPPDACHRAAYAAAMVHDLAGRWSEACQSYERVPSDLADAADRLDRVRRLIKLLPWADNFAGAQLVADPIALRLGVDLYAPLAAAGVTAASSAEDVKEASFVLMRRSAMNHETRAAWDRLRVRAERLRGDAFMHVVIDSEAFQRAQATAQPQAAAALVESLCAAVPATAPLIRLLEGDREAAVAAWERRLRAHPADAAAAHGLALARFWQAHQLAQGGAHEQARSAWEASIAAWALVLTDDAYWSGWGSDRARTYGEPVSLGETARLRRQVGQQILGTLGAGADIYARDGRAQLADDYRRLARAFEIELEAAQLLKDVGGLPLEAPAEPLACGPLYLRRVRLELALSRRVADLAVETGPRSEDLITSLDTVLGQAQHPPRELAAEMTFRLRCAFSELDAALLLCVRGQPEAALQALPPVQATKLRDLPVDCDPALRAADPSHVDACEHCCWFVERGNWTYLLLPHRRLQLLLDTVDVATRASLALGQTALARRENSLDEAVKHWAEAVDVSRRAGSQVRTKRAIVRVVLGRADALSNESGPRRGARLTEAITLIAAAREIVGGADENRLLGKHAEMLAARGVWHCRRHAEPDYSKATADLRLALELNPESVDCRDNLARALTYWASHPDGNARSSKIGLLADALEVLDESLQRLGGQRQFRDMFIEVLHRVELWAWDGLPTEELLRGIKQTGMRPAPAPGLMQQLTKEAEQKLKRGDPLGGLLAFVGAARENPYDEQLRRRLLDLLRELAAEQRGEHSG
jgi:hypothetical protein